MKEKKFKEGDMVTYRNKDDCKGGEYNYKGECQGGYIGTIREYSFYVEEEDCWKMEVTSNEGYCYSMLESEFLEYDVKKYPVTPEECIPEYLECIEGDSGYQVEGRIYKFAYISGPHWGVQCNLKCGGYEPGDTLFFNTTNLKASTKEAYEAQLHPPSKFNVGDVVNTNNKGYQYTDMDRYAKDITYTWQIITNCDCKSYTNTELLVKNKVYSKIQNKWWYKFNEFGNWISECGVESADPMEALLKEAIENYPVGSFYEPMYSDGEEYSNGYATIKYTPKICADCIEAGYGYIYANEKWARKLPSRSIPPPIPKPVNAVSFESIYAAVNSELVSEMVKFAKEQPKASTLHMENPIKIMEL